MTKTKVTSFLILETLLLGLTGCASEEAPVFQSVDAPDAEVVSESPRAILEAEFGFLNAVPDAAGQASYRTVAASVPTSGSIELIFRDPADPETVLHTEWVENAPFGAGALRVPADIQGEVLLSAWIYGDDGSTYATADLVVGADGAPLYPDAPRIYLDLRYDEVTDLDFVFFQQLSFEEGSISLSTDIGIDLQLTEEQVELVGRLAEPVGVGQLSGCLAYGLTSTGTLSDSGGLWSWSGAEDLVMLPGLTCTYSVELKEDGAPRLRGSVDFVAPGSAQSLDLSMEMEVVDAYVDVTFSVMGTFADLQMAMDESLVTYLDESDWDGPLRYVLTASDAYGESIVAEMAREGDSLHGVLSPVDQYHSNYNLQLQIFAGDVTVLAGWGTADLQEGAEAHIQMAYSLDVLVGAENITNVQFNAWLSDLPEESGGIRIEANVVTPEGITMREACETGDQSAYSCTLRFPTGSSGEFKVSHEGYLSVYQSLSVDSLETISLAYVALEPGDDDATDASDPEEEDESEGGNGGGNGGGSGNLNPVPGE